MGDERVAEHRETLSRSIVRWGGAACCAAVAHGAIVWVALNWQKADASSEPAGAIMIELMSVPVAPEAPPQDVAIGEQQQASVDSTETEAEEEPEEPEEPEPPEPEPPKPAPPEEPLDIPELEEVPEAAAVLETKTEPPPPEPEKIEQEIKKPPEPIKPKRKPPPRKRSAAAQASAPRPVDAKRAQTNAAQRAGMSSSQSPATWRGALVAHLNRHKRHPGGARGTARVSFTINRAGSVLSVSLAGSSGNPRLDQEALSLIRRAAPLPRPPANFGGQRITLSVPVHFR